MEASDDLSGNLKFMDGNPYVINNAEIVTGGTQFANIEPDMKLLARDPTNVICATDTYFDPSVQRCTRFPYSSDLSLVYTVVNNVQNGHQMVLSIIG